MYSPLRNCSALVTSAEVLGTPPSSILSWCCFIFFTFATLAFMTRSALAFIGAYCPSYSSLCACLANSRCKGLSFVASFVVVAMADTSVSNPTMVDICLFIREAMSFSTMIAHSSACNANKPKVSSDSIYVYSFHTHKTYLGVCGCSHRSHCCCRVAKRVVFDCRKRTLTNRVARVLGILEVSFRQIVQLARHFLVLA